MCTVTVVPYAGGVRLLCNRDERRSRAAALPPRVHDLGGIRAIFPVDPQGTGTWIGCNSAGLAVALLNAHMTPPASGRDARQSRGSIVRQLLRSRSITEARETCERIDPRGFAAFQVIVVHDRCVANVASDGLSVTRRPTQSVDAPLLFTSSSLGDSLVEPPRRVLFDRLVLRGDRGWLAGQAQFHDHQWPERPEISVRMERADALTVSRATVDLTVDGCELRYEAPVRARELEGMPCCLPH
jgi:hypothetical protein